MPKREGETLEDITLLDEMCLDSVDLVEDSFLWEKTLVVTYIERGEETERENEKRKHWEQVNPFGLIYVISLYISTLL